MSFLEKHNKLLNELYDLANPIIKYRIDTEIFGKENTSIDLEDKTIKYWLNTYKYNEIRECYEKSLEMFLFTHGSTDGLYENSIAKLLDFGLTKDNPEFDRRFGFLLEDRCWQENNSFEGILTKTVRYPFLIRAGYSDNESIANYFENRLVKIEKTIQKYGYDFENKKRKKTKKYENEFVFKMSVFESLPTIYDLYAFAFYPKNNSDTAKRIENIVQYLLDEKFQSIPPKAYIFDEVKKRYYAVGNVYQACMIDTRKLLTLYMLSHFKVVRDCDFFVHKVMQLLSTRNSDGFYEFDKTLINEKKDCNYIYTGNHMGLGEDRRNKNWLKIESTFWMLKILQNLENNNIVLD
ncbi:MAG: hypothetical protein K0R15_3026 [Clostridiales bacterium]|jgi:hypothetical protein|nr:hypothetical protein [Clostridiales bacterium]